jgi:hypothetical protein
LTDLDPAHIHTLALALAPLGRIHARVALTFLARYTQMADGVLVPLTRGLVLTGDIVCVQWVAWRGGVARYAHVGHMCMKAHGTQCRALLAIV